MSKNFTDSNRKDQEEIIARITEYRWNARQLHLCGRKTEYQSLMSEANKLLVELDDPLGYKVDLLLTEAQCFLDEGKREEMIAHCAKAKKILVKSRLHSPSPLRTIWSQSFLVFVDQGKTKKARQNFVKACNIFRSTRIDKKQLNLYIEVAIWLANLVCLVGEPNIRVKQLLSKLSPELLCSVMNPTFILDYYFLLASAIFREGDHRMALRQLAPAYELAITRCHYSFQAAHIFALSAHINKQLASDGIVISSLDLASDIVKVIRDHADNPHQFDGWYASLIAKYADALAHAGSVNIASLCYRKAYNLNAYRLGASHPNTLTMIRNVGECARMLGDDEYALWCFLSVFVQERQSHAHGYGQFLTHLKIAETAAATGHADLAAHHINLVLTAFERHQVNDMQLIIRTLATRAIVAHARGDLNLASQYIEKIRTSSYVSTTISDIDVIEASIALDKKNWSEAVLLANKAIEKCDSTENVDIHLIVPLKNILLTAYTQLGDWSSIRGQIKSCHDYLETFIMDSFGVHTFNSHTQILTQARSIEASLLRSLFETSDTTDPSVCDVLYDSLCKTRGFETRCGAFLRPSNAAYEIEGEQESFERFVVYRKACITTMHELFLLQVKADGAYDQIAPLQLSLRQLTEDWISGCGSKQKVDWEVATANSVMVRQRLSVNQTVIEFIRTPDREEELGSLNAAGRYYAFVVHQGCFIECFDLGWARVIDRAIDSLRVHILESISNINSEKQWQRKARFLSHKIFDPLPDNLFDISPHLIIVPDGKLWELPFDILPACQEQVFDCSMLSLSIFGNSITRLDSTRRPADEPIVIGGIDFCSVEVKSEAQLADELLGGLPTFSALEDSMLEVKTISKELNVEPIVNREPNKRRLLAMGTPEILHLATHGFYIEAPNTKVEALSPMVRCGLAIARGEQKNGEAPEDGVLWGFEIEQLDLRSTDIVFLAACRTAVGSISFGDGSQSLLRAFLYAGAHTVISSLWDVPSKETQLFAVDFYRSLLAGENKLQAFWKAKKNARSRHPHSPTHWAGFVLTGDSGPLFRFRSGAKLRVLCKNGNQ